MAREVDFIDHYNFVIKVGIMAACARREINMSSDFHFLLYMFFLFFD